MRRGLFATAFLLLASIAAASPTPTDGVQTAHDDAVLEALQRSQAAAQEALAVQSALPPLATMGSWLPVLQESGYEAAMRAAQEPGTDAAAGGITLRHNIYRLGDADGDGRDDVVVQAYHTRLVEDQEPQPSRFEALSAGRESQVLWSRDVPVEESFYAFADVDGDEVVDFVSVKDKPAAEGQEGATFAMLSGRDLSLLREIDLLSTWSQESSEDVPDLPVGRKRSHQEYKFQSIQLPLVGTGFILVTRTTTIDEEQFQLGDETISDSFQYEFSTTFEVQGGDGARRWAFEEPGWEMRTAPDVNGDGNAEFLVMTADSFGYNDTIVPPLADEPMPPHELRLLSGADGSTMWSLSFTNVTFSFPSWLGDVFGNGQSLAYTVYDFESFDSAITVNLIDGLGEIRHAIDGLSQDFSRLGDVNGDGRDDLARVTYDNEAFRIAAVTGDLTELWSTDLDEDETSDFVDIDGDGVRDLLLYLEEETLARVLSGRNGQQLWEVGESRMKDILVAPPLHGELGGEVAILLSDAEETENLGEVPADLLLVRGSDGAPLWRKTLFEPNQYEPVGVERFFIGLSPAGDVDGDDTMDYVLRFYEPVSIYTFTQCTNDDCETSVENSRDGVEGQVLAITMLIDAAGRTILRYDDMVLAPQVEEVHDEKAVLTDAGREELKQESPGMGLVALLAGLAVVVLVRRRS